MVLIIDTSKDLSNRLGENQIALAENSGRIIRKISLGRAGQAQQLLTKIDELLKLSQKSIKNITAIVIFTGPGYFTGLRVGIAIANGFGYSLGLPVAGINNKMLPKNWQIEDLSRTGVRKIPKRFKPVRPFYGMLPKTTSD